jgi:hypothetical protein
MITGVRRLSVPHLIRRWSFRILRQAFRNGTVECVRCATNSGPGNTLNLSNPEIRLSEHLILSLTLQKTLGVEPPLAVIVSITGLGQYTLERGWVGDALAKAHSRHAPRNTLLFPEIIIESYAVEANNVGDVLKPVFDVLWNAAGFARAASYDNDGHWVGQKYLFGGGWA